MAVHRGELTSADFPASLFDVVTLWYVTEHLPNPLTELEEGHCVLRDDGLLVLELPNSHCPIRRLCGARWRQLDIPRHLQHFTLATLESALTKAGFALVHKRNFHVNDFTIAFYSYMDRLGISKLSSTRYFSTEFQQASPASTVLFLTLGVPIACLCLPYSVVKTLVGEISENLTVTARKAAR